MPFPDHNYRPPFFWLHIKKSAGTSIRKLLSPHYIEVDRTKRPYTFIKAHPKEYNDILNNFRILLGDHQYKRALFAKEYLYHDWESIHSFAFVRNPLDRFISMFFYLYTPYYSFKTKDIPAYFIKTRRLKKILSSKDFAFDTFIDIVEIALKSDNFFKPFDLHFQTHIAPMWGDVSDHHDNLLLKKIYRLEDVNEGIKDVMEACQLLFDSSSNTKKLNTTPNNGVIKPTKTQKRRIELLYSKDFELYESTPPLNK